MINLDKMRTTIAEGLKGYLNCPVIRSNQTGEPPPYPYLSYTITTLLSENKGTYGEYEDGMDRKPATQIWSITVQSDNVAEAMDLAVKAHQWLDHVGTIFLNDQDIVVQSVGSITNRDNLISIEYEYRNGFDVVFWLLNEVESNIEDIGYIETVDFSGNEIQQPPTTDELIEKLDERLSGR